MTHQAPVQDQNRIAGSVIGGVLGGVLGNQVGGGNGKKAATVIGALAGGLAGNKVQEGMQQRDQVSSTQTICNEVNESSEKVVGYDVKYSLDGKTDTVRMNHKPRARPCRPRTARYWFKTRPRSVAHRRYRVETFFKRQTILMPPRKSGPPGPLFHVLSASARPPLPPLPAGRTIPSSGLSNWARARPRAACRAIPPR